MAIKTIAQLDPLNNATADGVTNIGGVLRMFADAGISDADKDCNVPQDPGHTTFPAGELKPEITKTLTSNNDSYYKSLLEVSVPIDAGQAGINSPMFNSYKITYEDFAKNLILDTKAYLNRRNNLGEFNLCALAYANYDYKGHKRFLSGPDDDYTNGNQSGRGVDIQGKLSATEDCTFDVNVSVGSNLSVQNDLSVHGNLSVDKTLSVKGDALLGSSLTVTSNVSVGSNLSVQNDLSVHGNLSVDKTLSVKGDALLGSSLTVTSNVSVGSNLSVQNDLSVHGNLSVARHLSATHAYFNGSVTITGDINVNGKANLTAEHAKWSDLAEYYLADEKYESGTLVQFGGDNEVTIAKKEVNAVVTTNPAFLMNCVLSDNSLGCAIALAGRVPVKVTGKVKKFDKLVLSYIPGVARARKKFEFWKKPIGVALECNDALDVKNVECIVKINLL